MNRLAAALCVTFLVLLAGRPAAEERMRIGVITPLSGEFAKYGEIARQNIERVRLPGIEWVFEDEACEPATAVSAFKKLSSIDRIRYFIGPGCGSSQRSVAPLLKGGTMIALLPNAAPAEVFAASGRRMYSIQYSLERESSYNAEQMMARGATRAAIVYVDSDFGRTHEAAFRRSFKGNVPIVFRSPAFEKSLMKDAAMRIKRSGADAIYIPDAAPLLLGFLTELRGLGVRPRLIFSVYSAQMKDVLDIERGNAEGLLYSYPQVPEDQDALGYFPWKAARYLSEAVSRCQGVAECVLKGFEDDRVFDPQDGASRGELTLKTVRAGRFSKLHEEVGVKQQ